MTDIRPLRVQRTSDAPPLIHSLVFTPGRPLKLPREYHSAAVWFLPSNLA